MYDARNRTASIPLAGSTSLPLPLTALDTAQHTLDSEAAHFLPAIARFEVVFNWFDELRGKMAANR